jgi:hypothetical protein
MGAAGPGTQRQEVRSNHARGFTCGWARALPPTAHFVFMQGSPDER